MPVRAGSDRLYRRLLVLILGGLWLAWIPLTAQAQETETQETETQETETQETEVQEAEVQDERPLGVLGPGDLEGAVSQFENLAEFYGALAERDDDGFARGRWAQFKAAYLDIASRLASLLAEGRLTIVDLPQGSLRVLPDGRIELDERLDGRWLPSLVRFYGTRGESETDQSRLLLPILVQALAQAKGDDSWFWFDEHVRRAGTLGPLAAVEAARPELGRYFFLKDRYLTLAMRRIAESDAVLRHDWARRQMRAFTEVRSLRQTFAQRFGAGPAELLRRDWSDYVALVDGFAVTRGWLMLDPTLRLTQMRSSIETGEVERAAGALMSTQERTILARRSGQRVAGATGGAESKAPEPSLEELLRRAKAEQDWTALQEELAANLPLQALLLRPELRPGPSTKAEFRDFAARLKEAIRQPDPRQELAKRDAALDTAEAELAALQLRVKELEPVEQEVAALQARVQALGAAEQQVAALKLRVRELDSAEQEVVALQERVRELDAAERKVEALQRQVRDLDAAEQEVAALQLRVQALDAARQKVVELQTRVRKLDAAEQEVVALQRQVQELNSAKQQVAALQARVEVLDAAEREVVALRERIGELNAAEGKVAALQQQVEELDGAEEKVAALEDRVQELDAAERELVELRARIEQLNVAERQVAALQDRVSELGVAQDQVAALQSQVNRLGAVLSIREEQAADLQKQLAEVRDSPAQSIAPAVSRIEERQLYMMAAIAAMFLLTLLLWLWRRERPVVVYGQPAAPAQIMAPPMLLDPPAPRRKTRDEPRPLPDVIEVPPASMEGGAEPDRDASGASWPVSGDRPRTDSPPAANGLGVKGKAVGSGVGAQAPWQQTLSAIQAAALGDEESAASHPIIRALRKGNLPLFELLFSELTDLRSPQLQRIVYGGGGEDLAIVCRAVGVDKLLFGAIFLLTDHLRGGDAESDPQRLSAIMAMYDRTAPETASKVLLKWQRNWGSEIATDSSLFE